MSISETATGNDGVAITGTASAGERTIGVLGQGDSVGVRGLGTAWNGVEGLSNSTIGGAGVFGASTAGGAGVGGESQTGIGVYGKSESTTGGAGVVGENSQGAGVIGKSKSWVGVYGESEKTAVLGQSKTGIGVHGKSESPNGGCGVMGEAVQTTGVFGKSKAWAGVYGESETSSAVLGKSKQWAGVFGVCESTTTGAGVWGKGGRVAGYFEGNVEIMGDLTIQGVTIQSLLQRIHQLEQKVNSGSSSTTQPAYVFASVDDVPGSTTIPKEKRLVITGGNFKPQEQVSLKITTKVMDENPSTEIVTTTAAFNGGIDYSYTIGLCNPHRTFQVQGSGDSSNKQSNISTPGC